MTAPFANELLRARAFIASEDGARAFRRAAPVVVFLVALAPRWWFVDEHPLEYYLVSNMAFFDQNAHHLLSGQPALVDTFTPAGYPAMVALAHAVSAQSYPLIGHVQAVLGAATCTLSYALALRITRSTWAALIAGAILAFYLPLVVYTGFLLSETLFAFLVTAFAVLLLRAIERPGRSAGVLAGLVLGFATAVRPNLALALPLLLAYALFVRRALPSRAWLAPLRAVACAVAVLVIPIAYNSRIAGHLTGIATNGGANFFLGHCECRALHFPPGFGVGEISGHQNRKRYTEVVLAERPANDEAYFYREMLHRIAERPSLVARAALNIADGLVLTNPGEGAAHPYYPGWAGHEDELRAFGRGFAWLAIVPAFLHALILAARRRLLATEGVDRLLLLTLCASMLATLYLFLGDPRLRVPFDPLLLVLAIEAWRDVASTFGSLFRRRRPALNGATLGASPSGAERVG